LARDFAPRISLRSILKRRPLCSAGVYYCQIRKTLFRLFTVIIINMIITHYAEIGKEKHLVNLRNKSRAVATAKRSVDVRPREGHVHSFLPS
jgi:hypothetical protein